MARTKTKNSARSLLLRALGLALCVIPPAAATLCYFPVWRAEGGETLLSGTALLLLTLAAIPIYKLISAHLRSPAAYTVWLIAFLLFLMLSSIAHEMVVISFVGFIGNLVGAILFRLAGGRNEGA